MKKVLIILCLIIAVIPAQTKAKAKEFPKKITYEKGLDPFAGTSLTQSEKELFMEAAAGNEVTVRRLLTVHEVDPNIRDNNGNTPLHYAKNLPIAALLVEKDKTLVNVQNNDGVAPLHVHVLWGHAPVVSYLIANGAKVNIADKNKTTPLHLATTISYFEDPKDIVDAAISAGFKTGIIVGAGVGIGVFYRAYSLYHIMKVLFAVETASHWIAAAGTITAGATLSAAAIAAAIVYLTATIDIEVRNAIVSDLVKNGANPNAQDVHGNAPLHILASGHVLKPGSRHGGSIMATHLITAGADVTMENNDDQTPYDIAKENNRLVLMGTLKEAANVKSLGTRIKKTGKKMTASPKAVKAGVEELFESEQ